MSADRSNSCLRERALRFRQQFRHAQIADANAVIVGQHEICGFDVSMQDVLRVQVVQSECGLDEVAPDGRLGQQLVVLTLKTEQAPSQAAQQNGITCQRRAMIQSLSSSPSSVSVASP